MRFPANLPNSTESEASAVSAEGRDVGLNDATAFNRRVFRGRAERLSFFKIANAVRSTQLNADDVLGWFWFLDHGLWWFRSQMMFSSCQAASHHESAAARPVKPLRDPIRPDTQRTDPQHSAYSDLQHIYTHITSHTCSLCECSTEGSMTS